MRNTSTAKRNLIFVGHDVGADIGYLRQLGYDPFNLSNLLETVDSATMFRFLRREPNIRSLGSILAELGITGWNLHNAGNDAVYTLQAMLAIAIMANQEKPDREARDLENKSRIAE